MIRRLILALTLAAALLPGNASAQEVTWQDVAQSLFIVAGTPVPYESPLLTEDDLQYRRVVQLKDPIYLKGDEAQAPLLLMMVPYEPVLWNKPTIFFLRSFSVQKAAGEHEIYGDVTWYGREGMFGLDYGPRPRLYTDELAAEIKRFVAQNEHYRETGAAYKPADDDPLLADIKNDLREIAKPIDFSKGIYAEKIEPHSLAIRRLLYRGEDIVPRLVSLLDSTEPFPAGSIIVDPTHFQGTDIGPPPSADTMAEAIDVLLGYWSGFIFGYEKSVQIPEHTAALWQTYLGYQLSGIDPAERLSADWNQIARSQFIIEGTLSVPGNPIDRDINDSYSSIWATLAEPRFLKGEDQGTPTRIPLDEHWIRRAKDIEGKVIAFSDGHITSTDEKPFYSLVYSEGQNELHQLGVFDFAQLDALLAAGRRYRETGEAFTIDANDPYWAKIRNNLKDVAEAQSDEELDSAAQRVVECGEPAVPYLVALLAEQEPLPYGKRSAFLHNPWGQGGPFLFAENWERLAAEFLSLITEQPLNERPFGSNHEGPITNAYWNTYLGQRLSTPEGRLALSHDPAVSKAEALRRAIAVELSVASSPAEIVAFFAGQALSPVYDEINTYGRITSRYQAVVPDANLNDDLDETVVVHLFLDEAQQLIGSDVRYLFDLYR